MNLSKRSVDVSTLDPKINNRLQEVRKILQQVDYLKKQINEQVGDLLRQQGGLEKQLGTFVNEFMPMLKELQGHAITAEGIYVELKKGRRSPKIGYDFLAQKVNSQLLSAAEEAITKAAEFASSPTFSLATNVLSKRQIHAGPKEWLTKLWTNLKNWLSNFKTRVTSIGKDVEKLDALTS